MIQLKSNDLMAITFDKCNCNLRVYYRFAFKQRVHMHGILCQIQRLEFHSALFIFAY